MILGPTGHLKIPAGEIEFAKFFPTLIIDLIFVPLATFWVPVVFGIGIYRFVTDLHKNAVAEGKAKRKDLNIPDFLKSLEDRYVSHLLVFFSFLGLFVVTNCFFVALYILQLPGPYSMGNPIKILANISAVALLVGVILMIYNRLQDKGENIGKGSYFDWSLIILVLGLVVTGILSEVTRIAHAPILAYPIYFVHLVFVFCLFAYLPFSKLAHMVYRTLAMAYSRYSEREPCE